MVAGPVSAVLMLSFAPSTLHFYHHVTMRRRKRRRYDEARGGSEPCTHAFRLANKQKFKRQLRGKRPL